MAVAVPPDTTGLVQRNERRMQQTLQVSAWIAPCKRHRAEFFTVERTAPWLKCSTSSSTSKCSLSQRRTASSTCLPILADSSDFGAVYRSSHVASSCFCFWRRPT
ncbi:hypothetical protein ANCCAN_00285 [Ancylostoma caninum]|uniref:Uncharacterized protein n=1 Tax=Ancylostoma caninum TaxID=29170 RepID=A0A368HB19_ANCCA|nr:hypothetical protein ANCCAN_00285 [Ancylostoma caninum]